MHLHTALYLHVSVYISFFLLLNFQRVYLTVLGIYPCLRKSKLLVSLGTKWEY